MIYHGCDELRHVVEVMGFRLYSHHENETGCNWIACKRVPSARRCECNDTKEGIQVVVRPHEMTIHGRRHAGVEVDIVGEVNCRWYKLMGYSIPITEFSSSYPSVEAALLRAWEALA